MTLLWMLANTIIKRLRAFRRARPLHTRGFLTACWRAVPLWSSMRVCRAAAVRRSHRPHSRGMQCWCAALLSRRPECAFRMMLRLLWRVFGLQRISCFWTKWLSPELLQRARKVAASDAATVLWQCSAPGDNHLVQKRDSPKTAPRRPQEATRGPQDGRRWHPRRPKILQETPKTTSFPPGRPKDNPEVLQEAPNGTVFSF